MARYIFNMVRPQLLFYGVDLARAKTFTIEKKLLSHLNDVWEASVQAAIEAMAPLVHVDTGMSVASLLPAARFVNVSGAVEARIAMAKAQKAVRWYYAPHRTSIIKSPASGIEIGENAFDYRTATLGSPSVYFRYSVYVYHFKEIEKGAYPGGPWGVTAAGMTALRQTFHNLWKPNVFKS